MAQVELFMRHTKGRSASYRITTSVWRESGGLRRVTLNEHALRMPTEARTFQSPPGSQTKKSVTTTERCLFCGLSTGEGDHTKCIPEGFGKDVERRRRWPWRK